MNTEAIFSDTTERFCSPDEPMVGQRVRFVIRTDTSDRAICYLCTGNLRIPMVFFESHGSFTYLRADYPMGSEPFGYWFEIYAGGEHCYYDRLGTTDTVRPEACFQLFPGFSVPDWSRGAVMYQILVDRFYNGDATNDVMDDEYCYIKSHVKKIKDWDEPPKAFDVINFYGGDLKGVMDKLDYLKSLGVEAVYFNPIFVSPSNHKYDAQDYDHIDPHLGCIVNDGGTPLISGDQDNTHASAYIRRTTDRENLEASDRLFAQFVSMAHEKGIKVILDGVFNHCGSFHKWLDREGIYRGQSGYEPGAYSQGTSPYRDFFGFRDAAAWPDNASYEGWWDHDTLPKLNYEGSRALEQSILDIAKKWVSPPYNADGWRLDVAADLGHSPRYNHYFWTEFRRVVKEANPQAVILAEHYGNPSSWLSGDQWDTIMNYDAFMEPVSYFLTGMEKHSDSRDDYAKGNGNLFRDRMRYAMLSLSTPSLQCSMNQLSNHDHSRFMTRTNGVSGRVANLGSEAAGKGVRPGLFRAAVVMQMTWPGAPTLYYADEAGQVGFTDPDNRRTYPWGKEDVALIDFHRDVIYLHRHSNALRRGSLIFLKCGDGYVSYARFDGREVIVTIVNSSDREQSLSIPVWPAEVPESCEIRQIFTTTPIGYSLMPVNIAVTGGNLEVKMQPESSAVFRYENGGDSL